MPKILITGATGQIGSALVPALRGAYGAGNVVAAGHERDPGRRFVEAGPYCTFDVRDHSAVREAVERHGIDTVFHLASLLSAVAEDRPRAAWDINMNGLRNVLEAARLQRCAVFFPSSIAVFGPGTPLENTPQDTVTRPTTMYGITKVAGELLCDYYHRRFGVDTRGVRYPGLISHEAPPGGGTTDYAVEMFRAAVGNHPYVCYLEADTRLDMMYMPDAVKAALELMEQDRSRLIHRNGYNITAMSFSPRDLAAEIRRHVPGFAVSYDVDRRRQAIAESWPRCMDDRVAREEWSWQPAYDLPAMVKETIRNLRMP